MRLAKQNALHWLQFDPFFYGIRESHAEQILNCDALVGLLGFFALMAGAKHVYAIEASSMAEVSIC